MEIKAKESKKQGIAFAFSEYVIERLKQDNAFGARLKRADNPATEYQAWEYLSTWCDLEKPWERQPFTTISAALARAKPLKDGYLGIGRSIAACYPDGKTDDSAKSKLRRLLACDTVEEICRVIRPVLRLIQSRGVSICYGDLLDQLLRFGEKQKLSWATDFYGRKEDHDRINA